MVNSLWGGQDNLSETCCVKDMNNNNSKKIYEEFIDFGTLSAVARAKISLSLFPPQFLPPFHTAILMSNLPLGDRCSAKSFLQFR
jgi:hypothetical protein